MKSAIRVTCIYIAAGVGLVALCIAISPLVVQVVLKCQPKPNIITKEVKTDEVKTLSIGGKIRSASGHIHASDSIELLDLSAHTSEILGTLRYPRENDSIKRISANEFLVIGGYNNHAWKTDTTPRPPELLDLSGDEMKGLWQGSCLAKESECHV